MEVWSKRHLKSVKKLHQNDSTILISSIQYTRYIIIPWLKYDFYTSFHQMKSLPVKICPHVMNSKTGHGDIKNYRSLKGKAVISFLKQNKSKRKNELERKET